MYLDILHCTLTFKMAKFSKQAKKKNQQSPDNEVAKKIIKKVIYCV